MMISYDKLSRNPSAFRSLTGLDRLLFDRLYLQVEQALEGLRSAETTRGGKQSRQRKPGAGRKYANDLRSRLVMTLFWLRVYPSYPVLAFFFSVDQSTISRNLREVLAGWMARRPLLAVRQVAHGEGERVGRDDRGGRRQ